MLAVVHNKQAQTHSLQMDRICLAREPNDQRYGCGEGMYEEVHLLCENESIAFDTAIDFALS